ncbi:hypothetical protein Sango_2040400 [Sesamum angolense]|uniref:Uncharacterized protein n=1 Tax=Sesamum angolense TaxID=2727404 RepID=A0AAE1WGE1_9LAMI|nr:hypothetical protein Sango_2040400 [Sesamum angolense]
MPQCRCGASKEVATLNNQDQLMQFLMGLSDSHENVKSQILMLKPLPSVSKTYSMVLRIEKKREVHTGPSNLIQNMVMQAKGVGFKRPGNTGRFQRRKIAAKRKAQQCDHCGKNGTKYVLRSMGTLSGTRTWLNKERKKGRASTSKIFSTTDTQEQTQNAVDELTISEMIKTENSKIYRRCRINPDRE